MRTGDIAAITASIGLIRSARTSPVKTGSTRAAILRRGGCLVVDTDGTVMGSVPLESIGGSGGLSMRIGARRCSGGRRAVWPCTRLPAVRLTTIVVAPIRTWHVGAGVHTPGSGIVTSNGPSGAESSAGLVLLRLRISGRARGCAWSGRCCAWSGRWPVDHSVPIER